MLKQVKYKEQRLLKLPAPSLAELIPPLPCRASGYKRLIQKGPKPPGKF
jgi:hypothetical protein